MNDELQQQLITWAKDAATIASKEAPELATQYIHWEMVQYGLGFSSLLAVFIMLALFIRKAFKEEAQEIGIIAIACNFLIGFGVIVDLSGFIKCIVAPKLVLLDLLMKHN